MASVDNRNILDDFIFKFKDKYNVEFDDFIIEKFIMDCFLNFIYSAKNVEDVKKILCLPDDDSLIAFLHISLFKEFINLFSNIRDVYSFLRYPQGIEQSRIICVADSFQQSERVIYKKTSMEYDIPYNRIKTCINHFLITLENALYKKIVEYKSVYGPCSINFCFDGQKSIYELNLQCVTQRALKKMYFDSAQEIAQFSKAEFHNFPGVGGAMYDNVVTALEECGFLFRDANTSYEGPVYLLNCKRH